MPTREELIKMGAKPVTAAAQPKSLTREQLLKMGAKPVGQAAPIASAPEPAKPTGFFDKLASVAATAAKYNPANLIVKPALQALATPAAGLVSGVEGLAGSEQSGLGKFLNKAAGVDFQAKPGSAEYGAMSKQLGARALDAASFLPMGEAAKGATVLEQALHGAKTGSAIGAMQGASGALQENKDATGVATGALGGGVLGGVLGGAGGALFGKLAERSANKSKLLGEASAEAGSPAIQFPPKTPPPGGVTSGVKDIVSGTVGDASDAISRAPANLKTNLDAAVASRKLAESAPEEIQSAVKSGLAPRDAKLIHSATPEERDIFSKMLSEAKGYESDRGAFDPASVGGSHLQGRIGEAKALADSVGGELGTISSQFSGVEVPGATESVISRLQKVPGLKGVKLTDQGGLDFSRTTLASKLNAGDAAQIDTAFKHFQGGDAEALHNFRQELFEYLGGKKKANVQTTDTVDKALEAIRGGLGDAIGGVSPEYKALNQKYAQIADPLMRLKKFYRGLEGASDDVLDERAGVLMRRLTSNAPSGQELKASIEKLDSILAENGSKSNVSLQKIQDFQNALERYYDISKDTGFAGQTGVGLSRASSGLNRIIDPALDILFKNASNTPAVKQKALEELLSSGGSQVGRQASEAIVPEAGIRFPPKKINATTVAPETARGAEIAGDVPRETISRPPPKKNIIHPPVIERATVRGGGAMTKAQYIENFLSSKEGMNSVIAKMDATANIEAPQQNVVEGIKNSPFFRKEGDIKDTMGNGVLMENNGRHIIATPDNIDTFRESGYKEIIAIDQLARDHGYDNGFDFLSAQLKQAKPGSSSSSPEYLAEQYLREHDPNFQTLFKGKSNIVRPPASPEIPF